VQRRIFACIAGILILAGIGYGAWHYVAERSAQVCHACLRPVHFHMKTVAMIDGKRANYCCPACAMSEHQQSGKPVDIVEVTDYLDGRALKPQGSFVVRNSDLNPCLDHHPSVGENSQPLQSHFDRCAPSILAFADQSSAADFAARHGGQVLKFGEFVAGFGR
jgi:hypothetical protein